MEWYDGSHTLDGRIGTLLIVDCLCGASSSSFHTRLTNSLIVAKKKRRRLGVSNERVDFNTTINC